MVITNLVRGELLTLWDLLFFVFCVVLYILYFESQFSHICIYGLSVLSSSYIYDTRSGVDLVLVRHSVTYGSICKFCIIFLDLYCGLFLSLFIFSFSLSYLVMVINYYLSQAWDWVWLAYSRIIVGAIMTWIWIMAQWYQSLRFSDLTRASA